MHKLICTNFTYYDDFYKNENYKKYREKGIDNCAIPCEEWMNEIGNKYYFIWGPQTKRRTKMEAIFGEISRDEYGYPKVYGTYLDKPYHRSCWDGYFPRYCWVELMNLWVLN